MNLRNVEPQPAFRSRWRLQEGGLLIVFLILGLLLSSRGGTVKMPKFEMNAQARGKGFSQSLLMGNASLYSRRRINSSTRKTSRNWPKDTSFIAIMAVGATFVIISGGIDLSVGSI